MRIDLVPDQDIGAAVRGAGGESIVVVIAPGRDPLAQALAEAAVGPLAIESAPAARVNAIVAGEDEGAVEAAAAFLEAAHSTTGQVLRLS